MKIDNLVSELFDLYGFKFLKCLREECGNRMTQETQRILQLKIPSNEEIIEKRSKKECDSKVKKRKVNVLFIPLNPKNLIRKFELNFELENSASFDGEIESTTKFNQNKTENFIKAGQLREKLSKLVNQEFELARFSSTTIENEKNEIVFLTDERLVYTSKLKDYKENSFLESTSLLKKVIFAYEMPAKNEGKSNRMVIMNFKDDRKFFIPRLIFVNDENNIMKIKENVIDFSYSLFFEFTNSNEITNNIKNSLEEMVDKANETVLKRNDAISTNSKMKIQEKNEIKRILNETIFVNLLSRNSKNRCCVCNNANCLEENQRNNKNITFCLSYCRKINLISNEGNREREKVAEEDEVIMNRVVLDDVPDRKIKELFPSKNTMDYYLKSKKERHEMKNIELELYVSYETELQTLFTLLNFFQAKKIDENEFREEKDISEGGFNTIIPSLQELIDFHFQNSIIPKERCEFCNKYSKSMQLDIYYKLPKYLFMTLHRFNSKNNESYKDEREVIINNNINIPYMAMDVLLEENENRLEYENQKLLYEKY